MKKLLFIIGLLFLYGCEDKIVKVEEEQSELSIITPSNNSTVTGIITIVVNYEGNKELERVEYYANSELIGTATSYPFSYSWNTNQWSNGSFELIAIGYILDEGSIVSNTVQGTIYNEVPTQAEVIFNPYWNLNYPEGYNFNLRFDLSECGSDFDGAYLIIRGEVMNIGGSTANNVDVYLNITLSTNYNNYFFWGIKNLGSIGANSEKSFSFETNHQCASRDYLYEGSYSSSVNNAEISWD